MVWLSAAYYDSLLVGTDGGCHKIGIASIGEMQTPSQLLDGEWEIADADVGMPQLTQDAYVLLAESEQIMNNEYASGKTLVILVGNEEVAVGV